MEDCHALRREEAERKIYSLSQLGESLKRTLEQVTADRLLWLKAEISKTTSGPTGHVYLDLVEEHEGQKLAAMRATLWKSQRDLVLSKLGDHANQVLSNGSEIVFSAKVQFHPVFGLSLAIEDIDLTAIIGEAERRKQAAIQSLRKEGAMERNRALMLPRLTRKIALVGSPGTSGYLDFALHLVKNEWTVGFQVQSFAATVQGKDAPSSLQDAILKAQNWGPDAIVVVRGGGSALDLDAFNDLELCRTIADAQCPVLTGIGHETDLCVADLVAHQHFKTPTAVADYLVDRMLVERSTLQSFSLTLAQRIRERLNWERESRTRDSQVLKLRPLQLLSRESERLANTQHQLVNMSTHALERHAQQIHLLSTTVAALQPANTLKRGFAVARKDGRAIQSAAELSPNDQLQLQFHKGMADVQVTHVNSGDDE